MAASFLDLPIVVVDKYNTKSPNLWNVALEKSSGENLVVSSSLVPLSCPNISISIPIRMLVAFGLVGSYSKSQSPLCVGTLGTWACPDGDWRRDCWDRAGGAGGLVQGKRDCHNLRKFLISHDSDG